MNTAYPFNVNWLKTVDRTSPGFREYCEARDVARMTLQKGSHQMLNYLELVKHHRGAPVTESLRQMSILVMAAEGQGVFEPIPLSPIELRHAA